MKPNFLCVGTYRSGTTWLYSILKQHPDVFLSDEKELMFFSHHFEKGYDWYESFFVNNKGEPCVGDITPTYLSCKKAPRRIAERYPNIKLIAILRNPPDQIFSLYQLWIARNYTKDDLGTCLKKEKEFLENVKYYKHIEGYLTFFDRKQILVMIYEDIKNDPVVFLKRIYEFLGIKDFFPDNILEKKNQFRHPSNMFLENIITGTGDLLRRLRLFRLKALLNSAGISQYLKNMNTAKIKKEKIPKDIREYIIDHVGQDMNSLEEYLGYKLKQWKQT